MMYKLWGSNMDLKGIITALLTPFDGDHVDESALRALVKAQIAAGVHGLVACGTTAETPSLSEEEYEFVARVVIEEAKGRVPVIVGTGTYNLKETQRRTRRAMELGADAALVVTPYYVRPQQEGLFAYFSEVARTGLPIIVYNVPGRTGVNLSPETTARLAQVEGIVGIKEASGQLSQIRAIVAMTPPSFSVLSGDDALFLPSLAVGCTGIISVVSNIAPHLMVALFDAYRAGRTVEAANIDRKLSPLYQALFMETNPVPVKAAAHMLHICSDQVRLPLVPASSKTIEAISNALVAAGLLQTPLPQRHR